MGMIQTLPDRYFAPKSLRLTSVSVLMMFECAHLQQYSISHVAYPEHFERDLPLCYVEEKVIYSVSWRTFSLRNIPV